MSIKVNANKTKSYSEVLLEGILQGDKPSIQEIITAGLITTVYDGYFLKGYSITGDIDTPICKIKQTIISDNGAGTVTITQLWADGEDTNFIKKWDLRTTYSYSIT